MRDRIYHYVFLKDFQDLGINSKTHCGLTLARMHKCRKHESYTIAQPHLVSCPTCLQHPDCAALWSAIESKIAQQFTE